MTATQPSVITGSSLWQWRVLAQEAALAADVPLTEIDWLLEEVAGLDRLSLRLESFKNWPQIQIQMPLEDLEQLWQQRLKDRLPVQYIAKVTLWRRFKLAVSPAVLIPRPETEYLIDLAVAATQKNWGIDRNNVEQAVIDSDRSPDGWTLKSSNRSPASWQQGHWADLGTGSGAIAFGLAVAFPLASIHAVDYSPAALSLAQLNAQQLSLADRIHFYQGSWWEPLEFLRGQISGMVANPPYIPSSMVASLQPEVANHEPHLALDGGSDGLDCIRQLVETSSAYLRPNGIWLIEMMAGQADAVVKLLEGQGCYYNIEIHPDLAGIERFALAYRL